MPHLTIEYSANVADHHDIDSLVGAAHRAALDHGLAAAGALRTRAIACPHFLVADGDPANAFIAIQARVAPGRDLEARQSFIEAVLDAAEAQVALDDGPLAIAWSIELTHIAVDTRINRNRVREAMARRQQEAERR